MRDDSAVSTVLGAILVFSVLAGALLYVNAYRTPEKGRDWEREQARSLDAGFAALAAVASSPDAGPRTVTLVPAPLERTPSLLRGLVLDPATPTAELEYARDATRVRVSHLPRDGGPRVYDIGSAASMLDVGRVATTTAGRYVPAHEHATEAGAVVRGAAGGHVVAQPPDWSWSGASGTQTLAMTVPVLWGDPVGVTGAEPRTVTLAPRLARVVGGEAPAASEIRLEIESAHAAAWAAHANGLFAPATASVVGNVVTVTLTPASGESLALRLTVPVYAVTVT